MKPKGFKPSQGVSVVAGIVLMVGVAVLIGWQLGNFIIDWATSSPGKDIRMTANTPAETGIYSVKEPVPDKSSVSTAPTTTPTSVVPPSPPVVETRTVGSENGLYKVHVGNFDSKAAAQVVAEQLRKSGYDIYVTTTAPYRVQVGAFKDQANASKIYTELEERGFDVRISFVSAN
jgi:cell division septation protein DedD